MSPIGNESRSRGESAQRSTQVLQFVFGLSRQSPILFSVAGSSTHDSVQHSAFRTTHWSVVCRAGEADSPRTREALETLCRAYWFPLYAYARRRGYSVEDAQDLTQQFFARILDRNLFAKADPARGRFRSFLLGSMQRFLANEWDKARAQKRGGGRELLPIQISDAETRYGVEPADQSTPEQIFERNWAISLLAEVLKKLEQEFIDRGQPDLWKALKPCVVGMPDEKKSEEIAGALGLSEGAFRVAVHRMRVRYRELLRKEVSDTVETEAEIDAEMRHLFKILARK